MKITWRSGLVFLFKVTVCGLGSTAAFDTSVREEVTRTTKYLGTLIRGRRTAENLHMTLKISSVKLGSIILESIVV